mgnify:CR=1 FL=1
MAKRTSIIGTFFARGNKRPQRLDIAHISERMRYDLGLPPVIGPSDIPSAADSPDITGRCEMHRARWQRVMINAALRALP